MKAKLIERFLGLVIWLQDEQDWMGWTTVTGDEEVTQAVKGRVLLTYTNRLGEELEEIGTTMDIELVLWGGRRLVFILHSGFVPDDLPFGQGFSHYQR